MILCAVNDLMLKALLARKFPIHGNVKPVKGTIMVGCNQSSNMKDVSLLSMVIVAFLLFIVGVFIPGTENPWHIILVVAGLVAGFTFYLLSFRKMLKDSRLIKGRRMFWIVSIVCLPMIGNIFYVIMNMMSAGPQIIKSED